MNVRRSQLHLVDLAGSERLKAGGVEDKRLRELTSINGSLSVLGLVIVKLTEHKSHIPYRSSKLTFLLQVGWLGRAGGWRRLQGWCHFWLWPRHHLIRVLLLLFLALLLLLVMAACCW